MEQDPMKARWEELVARLKRERDELALKMHLGRKDLADEWSRLEGKWKEFKTVKGPPMREAAAQTAEGVRAAMELAAEELKKGYDKIRKML
jgi:hypothetical protein